MPAPVAGADPALRSRVFPRIPSPTTLSLGKQLTFVQAERLEVHGNVMLLTAQRAGTAFQVIPVAGVLSDPLNLVAAVGLGRELGNGALSGRV